MTSYQSPPSPPPHLLDLHPVEILLVLLWISAAALLRLVANPPRLMRQRVPNSYAAIAFLAEREQLKQIPRVFPPELCREAVSQVMEQIRQPQASAAPAVGIAPGLTVAELRREARARGLASVGGRPIHKARRVDLFKALY